MSVMEPGATMQIEIQKPVVVSVDKAKRGEFRIDVPIFHNTVQVQPEEMSSDDTECNCPRVVGVRFEPVGGGYRCACGSIVGRDGTLCEYCYAAPNTDKDDLCETCRRLSGEERMICCQKTHRICKCDDVLMGRPTASWWSEGGGDAFCQTCVGYNDDF